MVFVNETQDSVSVNDWPPNSTVTVDFDDDDDPGSVLHSVDVPTGPAGNSVPVSDGFDIQPGQHVRASCGEYSTSFIVDPDLAVTNVDAATNFIEGHAAPGATVRVGFSGRI